MSIDIFLNLIVICSLVIELVNSLLAGLTKSIAILLSKDVA